MLGSAKAETQLTIIEVTEHDLFLSPGVIPSQYIYIYIYIYIYLYIYIYIYTQIMYICPFPDMHICPRRAQLLAINEPPLCLTAHTILKKGRSHFKKRPTSSLEGRHPIFSPPHFSLPSSGRHGMSGPTWQPLRIQENLLVCARQEEIIRGEYFLDRGISTLSCQKPPIKATLFL